MLECLIILIAFVLYKMFYSDNAKQKPLLILDMNNVLVYRSFQPTQADETPETVAFNNSATILGKFYTWKRPNLDQFIDHCFTNFTVAVWSSAQKQTVDNLVEFVFGNRKTELLFVWDQTKCETVETGKKKPLFKKQLVEVWKEYPDYDKSNTFLMDDSPEKVADNPPETWLQITPWKVTDENDNVLSELTQSI